MDNAVLNHLPPRVTSAHRKFLLMLGIVAVATIALVAVDLRDTAEAENAPATYNLCLRSGEVRDEIMFALLYPNRDHSKHHTLQSRLGASVKKYESWAKWDAPNERWQTKIRCGTTLPDPSDSNKPGIVIGVISATDLAADANWPTKNQEMRLLDHGMTSLKKSDFAGLTNLTYIDITGNSITHIPANTFVFDNGIQHFRSRYGNEGLVPHAAWFTPKAANRVVKLAINNNGLKHSDIPYNAFDGFFDRDSATSDNASSMTIINLREQDQLAHVNLRWYAPLSNLDTVNLDLSYVDTYFYAEGNTGSANTVRYTNGAKTDVGEVDFPIDNSGNLTAAAKTAFLAAVKAEVDRYFGANAKNAPGTPATAATVATLHGPVPGYDLCDRQVWIREVIISELVDPDDDPNTNPPKLFKDLGCAAGKSGGVSKANLRTYARWPTEGDPFKPEVPFPVTLTPKDIEGIGLLHMDLSNTSIKSLPAGIFDGLVDNMLTFKKSESADFQVSPKSWFGTGASAAAVTSLTFNNTGTTAHDLAHDEFDGFTNLQTLDLRDNPLGYVNTRWFERVTNLSTLLLGGSHVGWQYYDADGMEPYALLTDSKLPYWNSSSLQSAIFTRRNTHDSSSATIDYGDTAAKEVPKIAIDQCNGNPKSLWAELMREANLLNEDDGTRGGSYVTNAGDVRHAGYATVADDKCLPVPGNWINPTTLAVVDTETLSSNSVGADWSINAKVLRFNDSTDLVDSAGALKSDLFAYTYTVEEIYLDRTGIKTIPAQIFQFARNLKKLSLTGNLLEDSEFAKPVIGSGNSDLNNFLKNFTKLRELHLDDNLLTEFDSAWLPAAARKGAAKPLYLLRISRNPITSIDVSNMDLTHFYMDETQVTELDSSILSNNKLQVFWYQSELLTLDGLTPDVPPPAGSGAPPVVLGATEFLARLPLSLKVSEPFKYIGNPQQVENAAADEAAVGFQLDHHARMKAINDAAPNSRRNTVSAVTLYDPCRPDVWSMRSLSEWEDSSETGYLCLTSAQKDSWITDTTTFSGATWMSAYNTGFTDDQAEAFITSATGAPMERFIISGSPDAFGTGFDNTVLNRFNLQTCKWMWQLRIVGTDINFTQASTILAQLAGVYNPPGFWNPPDSVTVDSDRFRQYYLQHLDLSYNPNLWVGATNSQLDLFLRGVVAAKPGFGSFTLDLAGTGLDFDTLKRILDSIDHYDAPPNNSQMIRSLDVSENPNLWNRETGGGSWIRVPTGEIEAMLDRLQGLTNLDIGDTGLTGAEVETFMEALADNSRADETTHRNSGIKSAMARMAGFSVADTDLSAVGAANLESAFGLFTDRHSTAAPALRSLNLARTDIDCADLTAIVEGLDTAGVLPTLTNLILDGNSRLLDDCPGASSAPDTCSPADVNEHPIVELFKRFENVRTISLNDVGINFNELNCVALGLDAADGTPYPTDPMATPDGAKAVRTFSIMDNPQAFTVPASGQTAAAKASGPLVVQFFRALPQAHKRLLHSGFTNAQRTAVETAMIGQTPVAPPPPEEEMPVAPEEPDPVVTPAPSDLSLESGRGSLRVTFTHDPMIDGEDFDDVERYEYRFRKRTTDPDADWGEPDESTLENTWFTVTVDLTVRGKKEFIIYGLDAETSYQVQLRVTPSTDAAPTTVYEIGGTSISVPRLTRIAPGITEVTMRAGENVRLEVDLFGTANRPDNTLKNNDGTALIFAWSDGTSGGKFVEPDNGRRVTYTAPSSPGTYTVRAEARPDGICKSHHDTDFGISDAARAECIATFTIRVTRAPGDPDAPDAPVNPAGSIPSSLTDDAGTAYSVFTPVDGGTFTGVGITVSAEPGAVPDRQVLGVSAAVSEVEPPEPVAGARMTIDGNLYVVNAIQESGDPPIMGFRLDDPIDVCLPLPDNFRSNLSDVVLVERKSDGSYGILSTKLRQSGGDLNVCGKVSALPSTVGVAKLGEVEIAAPTPTPEVEGTPETGATAPSTNMAAFALGLGIALVSVAVATAAVTTAIRRRRTTRDNASS